MEDIHRQDVRQLLDDNQDLKQNNKKEFEKYQTVTDFIKSIKSEIETNGTQTSDQEENSDDDQETETTTSKEIEDFNQWVRIKLERTCRFM